MTVLCAVFARQRAEGVCYIRSTCAIFARHVLYSLDSGQRGMAGRSRARGMQAKVWVGPLGPLGFDFAQHSPTTRPSVERTAEKVFCFRNAFSSPVQRLVHMRYRVALSGCFELNHMGPLATHTEPKSAGLWLMVSHGWSIRSPSTDTPQSERDCTGG